MNPDDIEEALEKRGTHNAYIVPVFDVGDGELGFEIPDVIMESLGLKAGDALAWERNINGYTLTKVDVNND